MTESAHDGTTMHCAAETDEVNDHGNPKLCDTELNWEDHGTYVQHPRGEDRHGNRLRDRFEASALRFDCPECGAFYFVCPVCYEAPGAPGWFRGESTGEMLACHNCNAKEAMRQERSVY